MRPVVSCVVPAALSLFLLGELCPPSVALALPSRCPPGQRLYRVKRALRCLPTPKRQTTRRRGKSVRAKTAPAKTSIRGAATASSRSGGNAASKQSLQRELARINRELQLKGGQFKGLAYCVTWGNRCAPAQRQQAAGILTTIGKLQNRADKLAQDLCRQHKDRAACDAHKKKLWRDKLNAYLQQNRMQFRAEDFGKLQAIVAKNDHQAFQRQVGAFLRKNFDQAGFACNEHQTRHHCSEHCLLKHRSGFGVEIARGVCAGGCHADNKWFKPAFASFSKWWEGAKKWVEKAAQDVGKELSKAWESIKDVFCNTVGMPICMVVDLVKNLVGFVERFARNKFDLGKTLKSYWDELKQKIDNEIKYAGQQLKNIFTAFKALLTVKEAGEIGPKAGNLFTTGYNAIDGVVMHLSNMLGLPKFISWPLSKINAAVMAGTLTGVTLPLALMNLGARKLFEWAIPELVLGLGGAFGSGGGGFGDKVAEALKGLLGGLGGAAGGLLGMLVKDEKAKERIRAVLEKIANVAGKVQSAIGAALSLTEKIATGSYKEIEGALAKQKPVKTELTADEVERMVSGLLDFVKDQVQGLLDPILTKLLGKGLSLLDRFLDIPRNILVAGVGTIPFAGGVLSSALNLALGFVVDLIKGFLIGEVMNLVHEVIADVFEGLKKAFNRKLFANGVPAGGGLPGVALGPPPPAVAYRKRDPGRVWRSASFRALVVSLDGSVDTVRGEYHKTAVGLREQTRGLVRLAMRDILTRGVADARLRDLARSAAKTGAAGYGRPGFTLTNGLRAALRQMEAPLAARLAAWLPTGSLRDAAAREVREIVGRLGSDESARALFASDAGPLNQIAARLVGGIRGELAARLVGPTATGEVRRLALGAIRELSARVARQGVSALSDLDFRLRRALARIHAPIVRIGVAGIRSPSRRRLLEGALGEALSAVEAGLLGPGGDSQESLLALAVRRTQKLVTERLASASDEGPGVEASPVCGGAIERFQTGGQYSLTGGAP